jgi:hypothetical protein
MSSNETLFGTSWSSGDPGDGDVREIDGVGRTRAARIATERSQAMVQPMPHDSRKAMHPPRIGSTLCEPKVRVRGDVR